MAKETNEPDRDVEAAAVRALDALTRALESFTKLVETATSAATKFCEELEKQRQAEIDARRGRS